jgi:elongator complex protein 6
MSTRIPPLLQPYLSLPPETSLIVLTSVLGASTNWLVLRYLHSFLTTAKTPDSGNEDVVSVLLVSFLRDYPFWRDAAARSGVDLDGAGRNGRFVFVDGLTGLFLPPPSGAAAAEKKEAPPGWTVKLGSPRVEDVGRVLHSVVDGMLAAGGKVVMVLDQVDVLLATAGEEEGGMATRLGEVIMDLQEVCFPCLSCRTTLRHGASVIGLYECMGYGPTGNRRHMLPS